MKWNKYTIETTTAAEDFISSMLADLGVEGIEIEDNVPLTAEDTAKMFIDILPELPPDEGVGYVSFYLDADSDNEEMLAKVREGIEEQRLFVEVGTGKICASQTEDKDWMNNWKEFFHSFTIDDILIKPTWEELEQEDADKILGLNVGADDYVTKPFNPLELVARVKSQLRRYTTLSSPVQGEAVYETGGLVVNDDLKKVTVDGEEVKLTPIEYNILLLLMKNMGKVYSISQIYEAIWNEEAIGADNTVAVHIRHIREKIEINPKEPRYLKVVWGVGYKIEPGV